MTSQEQALSTTGRPLPLSTRDEIFDANGMPVPAPQRASRVGRLAMMASLVLLAALVVWALTAPLEEGVPASGSVVVDTKRKAVQHATGGIVRELLTSEGAMVREGDVLMRLDDAAARAQREAVRQRYVSLRAAEARLIAERDDLAAMPVHEDLQDVLEQPFVAQQWTTQGELLQSRRAALRAAVASLEEALQGQQASLEASRAMLRSREAQAALLRDQLSGISDLVADGFVPRNRQLELERQAAELQAVMDGLRGSVNSTQRNMADIRQRITQRLSEYRRDVGDQLAVVYRDVEAESERLNAVSDELGRTEIRAPASGQVVGLIVPGPGTVLQPAQKLADVVPGAEPLLLEVRVPPHVIDRVHAGQAVDVRFNNFAQAPHLVVQGRVNTLSTDALTDPNTQASYYLARVALTPEGVAALGKRQIQAGMPADVILRTGERSLLTYWLQPLLRRIAASMTEA